MIEARNLVKRYGATLAVDDVSFTVKEGEIVGFLGPNGAGKSTTLKILTCFIVADSGKVSIEGRDVLDDSLAVRRCVGYLPESTAVYADMRVLDYLKFVARARQIPAPRVKEAIDRVVATVEIERMLMKNVGHLSKGYRQRVGLAQALIHDPAILILDEPTSGLDPHQIVEIRELLRQLGKSKVILFSSHILQEISAVCSRILVINEGRLVADDTPAGLQKAVSGQQVFRTTVVGPEADVCAGLESIDAVQSVEVLGSRDGAHDLRVRAGAAGDVGRDIYRTVAEKGWELSVIEPEMRSLEEVYLQLTAKTPAA